MALVEVQEWKKAEMEQTIERLVEENNRYVQERNGWANRIAELEEQVENLDLATDLTGEHAKDLAKKLLLSQEEVRQQRVVLQSIYTEMREMLHECHTGCRCRLIEGVLGLPVDTSSGSNRSL